MRRIRLGMVGFLAVALCALMPGSLEAQTAGQITGRVTGAAGNPLAGVSVSTNGLGALTNADGQYTIQNVPAGSHSVSASLIGFTAQSQTVTVSAGQAATLNFQLAESAVQLEGIVAVGYGTTRSQDVTGAVASLSSEAISDQPPPRAR